MPEMDREEAARERYRSRLEQYEQEQFDRRQAVCECMESLREMFGGRMLRFRCGDEIIPVPYDDIMDDLARLTGSR